MNHLARQKPCMGQTSSSFFSSFTFIFIFSITIIKVVAITSFTLFPSILDCSSNTQRFKPSCLGPFASVLIAPKSRPAHSVIHGSTVPMSLAADPPCAPAGPRPARYGEPYTASFPSVRSKRFGDGIGGAQEAFAAPAKGGLLMCASFPFGDCPFASTTRRLRASTYVLVANPEYGVEPKAIREST